MEKRMDQIIKIGQARVRVRVTDLSTEGINSIGIQLSGPWMLPAFQSGDRRESETALALIHVEMEDE
jgi:hypothetical protein